ncbi:MAG: DUF1963 domain-containing protein [Oscillospiraceae bacterium]|nr:DUF1963 domain-containing protein [Oscillospiraceae bacterium]
MRYIAKKYGYGTALVITGIIALILTLFAAKDDTDRQTGLIASVGCFVTGWLLIVIRRMKMKAADEQTAATPAEPKEEPAAVSHISRDAAFIADKVSKDSPPLPALSFTPVRGETKPWDTKLGGVPYMPAGMEYPAGRDGVYKDKPLRLLAQLCFDDLPPLEGFPEKGILQFFCSDTEDGCFGLDFDKPFDQNGFRVIYHPDVIKDESKLMSVGDMPETDGDDFPFDGEYLLTAEPALCPVSAGDFRAQETLSAYNDSDDDVMDEAYDMIETAYMDGNTGTCAGGYPDFTQSDPRPYCDAKDRTVLLFQLGSEPEDGILWGDCGIGNFFISPKDLEALDFSRVLFNWDCC